MIGEWLAAGWYIPVIKSKIGQFSWVVDDFTPHIWGLPVDRFDKPLGNWLATGQDMPKILGSIAMAFLEL